jgi:hypothetical protein
VKLKSSRLLVAQLVPVLVCHRVGFFFTLLPLLVAIFIELYVRRIEQRRRVMLENVCGCDREYWLKIKLF